MAHPKLLTNFLPYTFANGVTIRRFAKACPKCGQVLESANMRGIAAGVEEHLYIAAHARCTHCHCIFSICCVVTDTKQVVKVPLPITMMKWWIRRTLRKRALGLLHNKKLPATLQPSVAVEPEVVSLSLKDVTVSEDIIGKLGDIDIFEWIEYKQNRYYFERTSTEEGSIHLIDGEQLFCHKLIYKI
ncbi:hypothetical protein [Neisseria sp. Ec49-e6-T10]|uniref:hypothetical protein n=1 Tax=Neisseria sp. Ec49-e6-T10 TaxID=3140744 RepID=UPI003EBB6B75